MKTKDDYIAELRKRGCNCIDDGGIIFILPMEKYKDNNVRKTLTKLITDIGYKGTWGMRPKKEGQMEVFGYGMRLRPFSIGCQPMDGLLKVVDFIGYHNELIYDHKLTEQEEDDYELTFLGSWDWNKDKETIEQSEMWREM